MKTGIASMAAIGLLATALPASAAPAAAPGFDAKAAQALAKKSGCLKCHDVTQKKEAKPLTEISKKYKGKADANDKITHHITAGEKVKLDDGTEEEHKIIKTKDKAEIQNVVDWIRSLAK